ncbi:MAG: hypothetical protein AB7H80_12655, partial [Candidatus Kapaibacterium sp.]
MTLLLLLVMLQCRGLSYYSTSVFHYFPARFALPALLGENSSESKSKLIVAFSFSHPFAHSRSKIPLREFIV